MTKLFENSKLSELRIGLIVYADIQIHTFRNIEGY